MRKLWIELHREFNIMSPPPTGQYIACRRANDARLEIKAELPSLFHLWQTCASGWGHAPLRADGKTLWTVRTSALSVAGRMPSLIYPHVLFTNRFGSLNKTNKSLRWLEDSVRSTPAACDRKEACFIYQPLGFICSVLHLWPNISWLTSPEMLLQASWPRTHADSLIHGLRLRIELQPVRVPD